MLLHALQPTDLVKIRFQSEGRLAPGQAPRYSGVLNAYTSIVKSEGLRGLWVGVGPAIARNSIINASELATYQTVKEVSSSARKLLLSCLAALAPAHSRPSPCLPLCSI